MMKKIGESTIVWKIAGAIGVPFFTQTYEMQRSNISIVEISSKKINDRCNACAPDQ